MPRKLNEICTFMNLASVWSKFFILFAVCEKFKVYNAPTVHTVGVTYIFGWKSLFFSVLCSMDEIGID